VLSGTEKSPVHRSQNGKESDLRTLLQQYESGAAVRCRATLESQGFFAAHSTERNPVIPKFHRPFTPASAFHASPSAALNPSASNPLRDIRFGPDGGVVSPGTLRNRGAGAAHQNRTARRLPIAGASLRSDGAGAGGDATLRSTLASQDLVFPAGHPGLDLAAVDEVRGALKTLKFAPRLTVGQSLTHACIFGYKPQFLALMTLIEHGVVDVDALDLAYSPGETFLHVIGKNRSDGMDFTFGYFSVKERVQMLVDAGADIDARCVARNMTPLDHACEKNNHDVIKALLNANATRGIYPE
jgi:hypothetical protein